MLGITGYLCLDLTPDMGKGPFVFKEGSLLSVGATAAHPGGVVGNTGEVVARLGIPAKLCGPVGKDPFAECIRAYMQPFVKKGSLEFTVYEEGPTAVDIVLCTETQDRMFLVNAGVNALMDANTFGPAFRKGLDLFHFGYPPICPKMAVNNGAELKKLYTTCQQEGILTSMDMCVPSPGTAEYEYDWIAWLKNLLPVTDVFCPSIDEIRFMLKMPTESPEEILERLLAMGASAIFLKLGSKGAMIRTADRSDMDTKFNAGWRNVSHFIPPAKLNKIYTTTGAGDSAIAGFLAGIDLKLDAVKAAEMGTHTAEQVISNPLGLAGVKEL